MTGQGILDMFSNCAFLQGLSERHHLLLASGARPHTAHLGDYLAREGEPARRFYLIQSGHVAIDAHHAQRGVVRLQTLGPGEVVGWSWIVPPYRWRFDVRAVDEVQTLFFDAEWLREQCDQDHKLAYHVLRQLLLVMASRLAATRLQALDAPP
jgi:CRP/FNR family cyclic AMP-dependent transcriptional regulator